MEKQNIVDLHLRVSPKLKELLIKQATINDQTLNVFCINILNNANLVKATILKATAEKESLRLYSSMSNNINQLSKHCNSFGEAATEQQLKYILEQAENMKKEIISAMLKKGVVIYGNL